MAEGLPQTAVTVTAVISALDAFLALWVASIAQEQKNRRGSRILMWMMVGIAVWSTGAAVEMLTMDLDLKQWMCVLEYLGGTMTAPLYLLFALDYAQRNYWLSPRRMWLFFIMPLVATFLAATNSWHHLIWISIDPVPGNPYLYYWNHGPVFWTLVVGHSYTCLMLASFVMLRSLFLSPPLYRKRVAGIVVASLLPVFANMAYLAGWIPIVGFDPTPVFLTATGFIFVWGITHTDLLDLAPVARSQLVERMPDGLLVFDQLQRLVDFNQAAEAMATTQLTLGMQVSALPSSWQAIAQSCRADVEERVEFPASDDSHLWYDAQIFPLLAQDNVRTGTMVLLRDISGRKRFETELRDANEQLRTLAVRDPLTGLFNRRFLMETVQRELARCRREGRPLSLIILDVDYFKRFNDSHGHAAGDTMLCSLAALLVHASRKEDVACRYGGEEFVVVLPGAHLEDAFLRAEAWRKAFEETAIHDGEKVARATFSAGVAEFPKHGETEAELIRWADRALYRAKSEGRNRVLAG